MSLTPTQAAQQALNIASGVAGRNNQPQTTDNDMALAAAVQMLANALIAQIASGNVTAPLTVAEPYTGTQPASGPVSTRH
jgi:hypothetical protein